jgi:hypothetical protein
MERDNKKRKGKHNMSESKIVKESKTFQFDYCGKAWNAYARYYQNGDIDIEIADFDAPGSAYDSAWIAAEKLGLMREGVTP